jgi:hypothetical protein
MLMIADHWVREFVNKGNPYFQSILGYSLPVLFVYLLTLLGIFAWEFTARNILGKRMEC